MKTLHRALLVVGFLSMLVGSLLSIWIMWVLYGGGGLLWVLLVPPVVYIGLPFLLLLERGAWMLLIINLGIPLTACWLASCLPGQPQEETE